MTFEPIHVYPDPLAAAVLLGLVWGLVTITIAIRRRTSDPRYKLWLLMGSYVLALGAIVLTVRALGVLSRHTEVLALGGIWFAVAGFVALVAMATYRLATRHREADK